MSINTASSPAAKNIRCDKSYSSPVADSLTSEKVRLVMDKKRKGGSFSSIVDY